MAGKGIQVIEEQKKCQVKRYYGHPCGRDVVTGGEKCICHSEDPDKDVELFQKEVDEELARDDRHNFSGFVFPIGFHFTVTEFPKDAYFRHAQFLGAANFLLFQFSGQAHFGNAKFSEEASFRHAKFSGMARFWSVQFSGEADFAEAQFTEGCGFDSTQFSRKADFRFLKLAEATQFVFRKTDLHNCLFRRTDIARIEFTDVMWPRRRKLFGKNLLFRRAVADELDPQQTQWEEVGDVYRGLHTNYTDHNRYADAGDFYVAEMDINRKTNPEWRYLIPSWFYRKVSLYGQSYLRPFLWLILFLLLFPLLLLYGGINLQPAGTDHLSTADHSVKIIDYDWVWSLNRSDFIFFTDDYWTTVGNNLLFLTFSRDGLVDSLPYLYQKVMAGLQIPLIVTLIAFFLLALRRQFKRKSF